MCNAILRFYWGIGYERQVAERVIGRDGVPANAVNWTAEAIARERISQSRSFPHAALKISDYAAVKSMILNNYLVGLISYIKAPSDG